MPDLVYKKKGWKNWYSFFDKKDLTQKSFDEIRSICLKLKIKNNIQYINLYKQNKLPDGMPYSLMSLRKYKSFKSVGDFLKTGLVASKYIKFKSFSEHKLFTKSKKFRSFREYQLYLKKNKNLGFTVNPQRTFKKIWKGWADFLGKKDKFNF